MLVLDGLVSAQVNAGSEAAFKAFVHDLQEIALAADCTMMLTTNMGLKEIAPSRPWSMASSN